MNCAMQDCETSRVDQVSRVEEFLNRLEAPASVTEELRELRESLVARERERFDLFEELAALEEQQRRLHRAIDEASRRGSDLASLYVATHRLHSTLDRGQVLQALEEIVASLLGCEELAVFELVGRPAVLAPVFSVGVPAGRLGLVEPGEGRIGACSASGDRWLRPDGATQEPVACVPLKVDGETTGVLVLYELLEHKGGLQPADIELLDLLGVHAGTALLASRLRARSRESQ